MKLLDRNGLKADVYRRMSEGQFDGPGIVSLAELADGAQPAAGKLGLAIENTANVRDVERHFDSVTLIVIHFPSFGDGRGFTLARRLRRAGFGGTLRASGPLIPDQFAFALACGFDEVELPEGQIERQPVEQWRGALTAFSAPYQQGYRRPRTILEERRRNAPEAAR
ncbi:MAG: DUF934 domain-containing protein [Hyphomicrobiales bacterium]|nr:DUF934 domain-containing protein [Hyphomicrobiales bacterium]